MPSRWGTIISVGWVVASVENNRRVQVDVVSRRSDVMSGTPVFAGTRVPVQNLIDYLEGGETLDQFLDDFPSVRREQAIQFLDLAGDCVRID
jgi:uncharacterized protein (DUF433 family)